MIFTSMVAMTHNRLLGLGLAFVLGFVIGPAMVASNTVINMVCNMEMSGKVFAALEFVMYLAFWVAMQVSSLLSQRVASLWILIVAGGIFMIVGVVGLFKFSPAKEPTTLEG